LVSLSDDIKIVFLFSCFSGLILVDVASLKWSMIKEINRHDNDIEHLFKRGKIKRGVKKLLSLISFQILACPEFQDCMNYTKLLIN
jgi:hypothetical protein